MADKLNTRLQTPLFRASYAYVWEPVADKQGILKYRILMMFPKTTDLTPLAEAAMNAAINKWGKERAQDMFANRAETGFKWPLRDGDVKAKAKPDKYGVLAGMNFCNASRVGRPSLSPADMMANAPMAAPRSAASFKGRPSRRPLVKPTAKPSPAPTVSTT